MKNISSENTKRGSQISEIKKKYIDDNNFAQNFSKSKTMAASLKQNINENNNKKNINLKKEKNDQDYSIEAIKQVNKVIFK